MTYVAIDPATGAHLRNATDAEIAAYLAQRQTRPASRQQACFDRPVRVGDVTIYLYTGPGIWFGGAGF